jgi:hypothetical protein
MLLFRCQSGVAGAAGLRHIHLVEFIGKLVVIVGKPLHRFSYPASDASNRRIISQPLVPYRAAKNRYVPKSPFRSLQCSGSAIGRHNNALKIDIGSDTDWHPHSERPRVPVSGLHDRLKRRRRPKHNQGFDGTAPVAEISLNLKIDMQRVGLNLCKNGFGAAYRAGVSWLEPLKAHCAFPWHDTGLPRFGINVLSKVELKARALCYGVSS